MGFGCWWRVSRSQGKHTLNRYPVISGCKHCFFHIKSAHSCNANMTFVPVWHYFVPIWSISPQKSLSRLDFSVEENEHSNDYEAATFSMWGPVKCVLWVCLWDWGWERERVCACVYVKLDHLFCAFFFSWQLSLRQWLLYCGNVQTNWCMTMQSAEIKPVNVFVYADCTFEFSDCTFKF